MTNEPTNTLNTKTIPLPLTLYKDALTRAMKNADGNWFKSLFALSDNNPDFILNEEGQTVWMLWNQICNEERVNRQEKCPQIESIMKDVHADDCDYLHTLYLRGGIGLLKKITEVKTDIRINARSANGDTILNKICKTETEENINTLRACGYRFGFGDLTGFLMAYYNGTLTFINEQITDAVYELKIVSEDTGARLIIYVDYLLDPPEISYSLCTQKEIDVFQEYEDAGYNGMTTYITLKDIIAGEKLTIDKNVHVEFYSGE